jgi:type VI secretion system protein ImpC
MPKTTSLERAEIALTATMEEPLLSAPDPETPLRLLVAGSFSGKAAGDQGRRSLGFDRLPVRVDRESVDDTLSEMDVSLTLRLGGESGPETTFRFRRLEDFHPDSLLERTPAFGALRRARAELQDPATFAAAAERVRGWAGLAARPAPPQEKQAPRSESDEIVAELLASSREKGGGLPPDVARMVQEIAGRYAVPADHPDAPRLLAAVDTMITSWLNAAMHDPAFQALESAWRGVAWLADRLETDSSLQLWLLDVSLEELAADLKRRGTRNASGWHRILVEQPASSPEPEPWAAVAGLYTFGRTVEDVALLARLASVAAAARAPFLAAASPGVVGSPGFGEAPDLMDWSNGGPESPESQLWAALRELPAARGLGLAAPRFLLRLPYGKDTEPAETVTFEEMSDSRHEDYLWGNPALACLALIGQAFSRDGWGFHPGSIQDLTGLPLHVYAQDGESRIKPCAEALLSPRASERLLDAGVMPLLSIPGRDAVRLARFQSLMDPPAPLAGRWTG